MVDHRREDKEEATREILARLRKIEGQVRGLERMVEAGRPCGDVMLQVSAVVSALRRVGVMMVGCAMSQAIAQAVVDGETPEEQIEALKHTLMRLS
jgi:DNA-binding FrmR family transcriptional regulator